MWVLKKITTPPLLIPLILFIVSSYFLYFMFFNVINNGLRYLLFVQPLLILVIASLGGAIVSQKTLVLVRRGIVLLLIWYIWGTVSIAPHYIAFANELIGGSKNLWKYVADSNIDWGQDQKFFELYHQLHPELVINPQEPTAGKIALSVNRLNLDPRYNPHWLRKLKKEPIDHVGYSWLIFVVTQDDLRGL
jgi:hypothetical protein